MQKSHLKIFIRRRVSRVSRVSSCSEFSSTYLHILFGPIWTMRCWRIGESHPVKEAENPDALWLTSALYQMLQESLHRMYRRSTAALWPQYDESYESESYLSLIGSYLLTANKNHTTEIIPRCPTNVPLRWLSSSFDRGLLLSCLLRLPVLDLHGCLAEMGWNRQPYIFDLPHEP